MTILEIGWEKILENGWELNRWSQPGSSHSIGCPCIQSNEWFSFNHSIV
jgi:hypothetical protein